MVMKNGLPLRLQARVEESLWVKDNSDIISDK